VLPPAATRTTACTFTERTTMHACPERVPKAATPVAARAQKCHQPLPLLLSFLRESEPAPCSMYGRGRMGGSRRHGLEPGREALGLGLGLLDDRVQLKDHRVAVGDLLLVRRLGCRGLLRQALLLRLARRQVAEGRRTASGRMVREKGARGRAEALDQDSKAHKAGGKNQNGSNTGRQCSAADSQHARNINAATEDQARGAHSQGGTATSKPGSGE